MPIRQEPQVLLNRSTNLVELRGLIDRSDGSYPEDATVSCTLLDADGNAIAGATNVTMPFVAGTSGRTSIYRGFVGANIDCTAAATARITIAKDGAQREINLTCVARDG